MKVGDINPVIRSNPRRAEASWRRVISIKQYDVGKLSDRDDYRGELIDVPVYSEPIGPTAEIPLEEWNGHSTEPKVRRLVEKYLPRPR